MRLRNLILATSILALAGGTEALARGGHGHGRGHSHGHMRHHRAAEPANPSVPPALTPDPRLTGSAPLSPHQQPKRGSGTGSEKRDPADVALDRKIKSICRGC